MPSLPESLLIEIGGILILLCISVVLFAKYRNSYWTRKGVPQIEPELFFGNARKLLLSQISFGDAFSDIYHHFKTMGKPVGGFYIALKKELMIVDIEIIKQIMIKDFHHFTDRGNFVDEKNDPLTGHLFALPGKKWKKLRAKLTPTFTSGKMRMMFQTLVDTSKEMNNILLEKSQIDEPLDIKDILARFTTDVIGSCAFGIECNCLKEPNTEFRKYGVLSFEPEGFDLVRKIMSLTAPWLLKLLHMHVINKNITNFFMNLVQETINYREQNNIYRKDFMHLLIQLKNQGKLTDSESLLEEPLLNGDAKDYQMTNLTIEEIAAQSFVFFLAGFETSSTTMTFCLYELATNQEIQLKLREEVHAVLEKYNGELSYEGIMEMTYMDKVINGKLTENIYF